MNANELPLPEKCPEDCEGCEYDKHQATLQLISALESALHFADIVLADEHWQWKVGLHQEIEEALDNAYSVYGYLCQGCGNNLTSELDRSNGYCTDCDPVDPMTKDEANSYYDAIQDMVKGFVQTPVSHVG